MPSDTETARQVIQHARSIIERNHEELPDTLEAELVGIQRDTALPTTVRREARRLLIEART